MTRIAQLVVGVLVVVVGVTVAGEPAAACSCAGSTDTEYLADAEAVFVGTVTGFDDPNAGPQFASNDPVTWTFAVEGVYKGDVAAQQEVGSVASGASCGLEVQSGLHYLVFADTGTGAFGTGDAGGLTANLCGGTRAVTPGERPAGLPVPTEPASAPGGALGPGGDPAPGGGSAPGGEPVPGGDPAPSTSAPGEPGPATTVAEAALAASATGSRQAEGDGGDGRPGWLVPVAGLGVVAIGAGAGVALARRHRNRRAAAGLAG